MDFFWSASSRLMITPLTCVILVGYDSDLKGLLERSRYFMDSGGRVALIFLTGDLKES